MKTNVVGSIVFPLPLSKDQSSRRNWELSYANTGRMGGNMGVEGNVSEEFGAIGWNLMEFGGIGIPCRVPS